MASERVNGAPPVADVVNDFGAAAAAASGVGLGPVVGPLVIVPMATTCPSSTVTDGGEGLVGAASVADDADRERFLLWPLLSLSVSNSNLSINVKYVHNSL